MSALKKKNISHNILEILENNLLLLFFNHNHVSTEEWGLIKSELSKIRQVSTLVVKNQIANRVIQKNKNKIEIYGKDEKREQFEKLSTLFQGPTFLMGISSLEKCQQVFNVAKKQKKYTFVGGIYQGRLISHLDLDYLLKVQELAYPTLLSTLQSNLYLPVISTPLINLYYLLDFYKNSEYMKNKEQL